VKRGMSKILMPRKAMNTENKEKIKELKSDLF